MLFGLGLLRLRAEAQRRPPAIGGFAVAAAAVDGAAAVADAAVPDAVAAARGRRNPALLSGAGAQRAGLCGRHHQRGPRLLPVANPDDEEQRGPG